mmetsp:Transcript_1769/g.4532  ORF Transcript_1769/g.4532 Transcript_1769/m.4532 type:complete len:258 (+) Transcript_1769:154-927(+)
MDLQGLGALRGLGRAAPGGLRTPHGCRGRGARRSGSQPPMAERLLHGEARLRVVLHKAPYEVLGLRRHSVELFDVEVPFPCCDANVQGFEVCVVLVERRHGAEDHVQDDAYGPHVHLLAVRAGGAWRLSVGQDHLGGEVVRSAAEGSTHRCRRLQLLQRLCCLLQRLGLAHHIRIVQASPKLHCKAKIRDLGHHGLPAGGRQQYVLRLEVPVHNVPVVQVLDAEENLPEQPPPGQLAERPGVEDVVQQVATLAELHD